MPAFAATFWAMKGLAPTQPVVAGAFSGFLAGAVGATVYCLHCPEMAPPFLGTWYLLGMAHAVGGRRDGGAAAAALVAPSQPRGDFRSSSTALKRSCSQAPSD